jgi:hypothetical protein
MRLAGVIFQYILTLYPEHPLDFEALGHELALAYQRVWNLLTWCLYFQCCMNVALVISLLYGPVRFSELIGFLLGVLRLLWLVVSILSSQTWPMPQYTLFFCVLYSSTQFMIISLPFRQTVVLFLASHVLYIVCLCWLSREFMTWVFISRQAAASVGIYLLNVWAEDVKRRRWCLYYVFCLEMKRFQDIHNDLLPTNFGQRQATKAPVPADGDPFATSAAAAQVIPPLLKFELNSLDPVNGINACLVVEALVCVCVCVCVYVCVCVCGCVCVCRCSTLTLRVH